MTFAVIAENDESQWDDDTGVLYHFPRRYAKFLAPGTEVVYYKGAQKKVIYAAKRLSPDPHYFGIAVIGQVHPDRESTKGDLFATIVSYQPFKVAVPAKDGKGYVEAIPKSRESNYWRDGVRPIDEATFRRIRDSTELGPFTASEPSSPYGSSPEHELESGVEGNPKLRYVTTYERDPRNRRQAIAIHGLRCKACDLDLGECYGPLGQGLIHVHHVQPVSTFDAPKQIDPAVDLVPVCPNCHAVIHRKKSATLSIEELRAALGKS